MLKTRLLFEKEIAFLPYKYKRLIYSLVFALAVLSFPQIVLACEAYPISWKPRLINFSFDKRDQPLEINKSLYFLSKNKKQEIIEVSQVIFYDFQDLYENFVLMRITPRSRCDKIRSNRFKVGVDKKGLVYGQFTAHYEDYVCFPLRFFQANPGVEKEPQVLRIGEGYVQVDTAIQPSFHKGNLFFEMSTIYTDLSQKNIVEKQTGSQIDKLYSAPLEGLLNDDLFLMFLEDVSSGLNSSKEKNKTHFEIDSIKFIKDQHGRIILQLISKVTVSQVDMCNYFNSKVQTGNWRIIEAKK